MEEEEVQCAMIWWHYQLLLSVSMFDSCFFKKGTQSYFLLYLMFVFSTQPLSHHLPFPLSPY